MRRALIIAGLSLAIGQSAAALDLSRLGERVAAELHPRDTHQVPIGPWRAGEMARIEAEGARRTEVWHLPGLATTFELQQQLVAALQAAGYDILFTCQTRDCGGFDFRFGLEVVPEPAMHVDLGDFRYVCAVRAGPGGSEYVSLLISRSAERAFVQTTSVGRATGDDDAVIMSTRAPDQAAVSPDSSAKAPELSVRATGLVERLERDGRAVIEGLDFAVGAGSLRNPELPELRDLAGWLQEDSARRVVLVGHTDSTGALAGNVRLSLDRARAVRDNLVVVHGIAGERVDAEGVGYLAPRATNVTEEGRALNRRVEVVLRID